MNFGRWHSTYPINESDDRFSAGQRCGQYHLIREGLAFRTFPPSPTLILLSFLWISHLPIYTLPRFRKIYCVFDFVIKSLRERQQSRQSPIRPKHLHRLPLDCKTQKKKFPVLARSPLPLVYQSGEFLCFLLVFFWSPDTRFYVTWLGTKSHDFCMTPAVQNSTRQRQVCVFRALC